MKAVVAAFNQEKALVRAFSVIVQPVVELMDRFAALIKTLLDLLLTEGARFSSHRRSFSSPLPRPNLILSGPCEDGKSMTFNNASAAPLLHILGHGIMYNV